jgi:hypothetical protein
MPRINPLAPKRVPSDELPASCGRRMGEGQNGRARAQNRRAQNRRAQNRRAQNRRAQNKRAVDRHAQDRRHRVIDGGDICAGCPRHARSGHGVMCTGPRDRTTRITPTSSCAAARRAPPRCCARGVACRRRAPRRTPLHAAVFMDRVLAAGALKAPLRVCSETWDRVTTRNLVVDASSSGAMTLSWPGQISHWHTMGFAVWQRSFHDRVLRNAVCALAHAATSPTLLWCGYDEGWPMRRRRRGAVCAARERRHQSRGAATMRPADAADAQWRRLRRPGTSPITL